MAETSGSAHTDAAFAKEQGLGHHAGMDKLSAQEMDDDLVDLLARGEEATAILACHRTSGTTLEEAWGTVRQLSIDLGEEPENLPKSAAADTTFREVRAYMAPSFWTRRKDQIQVAVVAALVLAASGYLFFLHLPPLITDLRSHFWPEVEATIVKVRVYTKRRYSQGRMVETDYMDYHFRYEVGGEAFLRGQLRVPYYDTFGERPYEVGDRITIFYNPGRPGQVVHRRNIYKRSIRLVIALPFLGFGALAVWYVVSRERVFRRLRQFDER